MYQEHVNYLEWIVNLLGLYGMDSKDLQAISLVGFTTHTMADIYETVMFNTRQAIKESHVITAQKMDSLYKHAREVGIFPTLSQPAEMDFVLIINGDDFDNAATITEKAKIYTIDKSNFIKVGDFIYSFDYDIEIYVENTTKANPYMHARYKNDEAVSYLPDQLKDIDNPTIKVTKVDNRIIRRKTNRGWEYHLYLRLKQYAREIYENEFQDRDYSAFNYTASGELVDVKCYRLRANPKDGLAPITPLDVKMYFEGSRTSKDSIFMNFESPITFTLIHKSQENGFRPLPNDKLITYVYTTAGSRGNFTIAKTMGDDIRYMNVSNGDLDINVALPTGISEGGKSSVNSTEELRQRIIDKRSTRDNISIENDLEVKLKSRARSNDHYVIKVRNDIVRIFNVFATLKYKIDNSHEYIIPTNTMDVTWNLEDNTNGSSAATLDVYGDEKYYNASTYIVKATEPGHGTLIAATPDDLLQPLMEEFRLGISEPSFTDNGDYLVVSDDIQVPVLTNNIEKLTAGERYYYRDRLYTVVNTRDGLKPGDAIRLATNNINNGATEENAVFSTDMSLYYWLPYYMVYIQSPSKNFVRLFEQTVDNKLDLNYFLDNPEAPYSFICNWARFSKSSIYREYDVHINLRNNLTGYTLLDQGFLVQLPNGRSVDTGKIQAYLVFKDSRDNIVYADRFRIDQYNVIPDNNDDYIDYKISLLPAGYIPKIIDGDKMVIWSSLMDDWVQVPLSELTAEVRVYDLTDANTADYLEDRPLIIPSSDGSGDIHINLYKNTDYTKDKYLVNHYSAKFVLLRDLTTLFKIQHTSTSSKSVRLLDVPMVQYTFFKNYAYLYHRSLKDEYDILDYVKIFQGEFSLALKYTNTYGFSRHFKIGINKNQLSNVQLDMSILLKKTLTDSKLSISDLSYTIAKYIENIDFTQHEIFHVSRLYDYLMDRYRDQIEFLEFREMDGKLEDNELLEMQIDRKDKSTIIEKINLPYSFDGGFDYRIQWKILESDAKKK